MKITLAALNIGGDISWASCTGLCLGEETVSRLSHVPFSYGYEAGCLVRGSYYAQYSRVVAWQIIVLIVAMSCISMAIDVWITCILCNRYPYFTWEIGGGGGLRPWHITGYFVCTLRASFWSNIFLL